MLTAMMLRTPVKKNKTTIPSMLSHHQKVFQSSGWWVNEAKWIMWFTIHTKGKKIIPILLTHQVKVCVTLPFWLNWVKKANSIIGKVNTLVTTVSQNVINNSMWSQGCVSNGWATCEERGGPLRKTFWCRNVCYLTPFPVDMIVLHWRRLAQGKSLAAK